MSFYSKNSKDVPRYNSADPNAYTYVEGYGFAPQPPIITEQRILQWYANGMGLSIMLYFILLHLLPTLFFDFFSLFNPAIRVYDTQIVASPTVYALVQMLSSGICKFLPFFFFLLLCRIPLRVAFPLHGFSFSVSIAAVCIGMAVGVVGSFSSNLISLLLSLFQVHSYVPNFAFSEDIGANLVLLLSIGLVQPMVEELMFRGMIFQSMRRFGDSFALLISSILFALFHGNLVQAPNAFIMGFVIGYFVLCTGSLWTGVLIHVVNNSLSLLMDFISMNLPEDLRQLFLLFVLALYLIGGIVALLILVKQHPNMFMFIRSTTFATERGKYRTLLSSISLLFALGLLVTQIFENLSAV